MVRHPMNVGRRRRAANGYARAMEWTWLVRIWPEYQAAEAKPRALFTYAPAAALAVGLLALILPRAGGVPLWWLLVAYCVHMAGWVMAARLYPSHPVAVSTVVAVVNLTLCTSLAAFTEQFVPPLWTFFLMYVLIGGRAFPFSALFALLVVVAPLAVGLFRHRLGDARLEEVLTPYAIVGAIGVCAYVMGALVTSFQRVGAMDRQDALRTESALRERTRIAGELHDTIGTSLAEIGLWLDVVERGDQEGVARAKARTRSAITELRVLVDTLADRPIESARAEALLRPRLVGLCEAASVALSLHIEGSASLAAHDAHHTLKIVEEATANAIRHGQPTSISVRIAWSMPPSISVIDDGRGFDPQRVVEGMGIASMRERAQLLGRSLRIESGTDRSGTTLLLEGRSETASTPR